MPDYGGILDLQGKSLKNHALNSNLPFKTKPKYHLIDLGNDDLAFKSLNLINDTDLIVTKYLDCHDNNQFSSICSVGRDLYFNSVNYDAQDQEIYQDLYCHLNYGDDITSLKHSGLNKDLLIINFPRGTNILQLNSEVIPERESYDTALNSFRTLASISERSYVVKDACLNHFNKSIHCIASDSSDRHQLKFYDLLSSRRHFHRISWSTDPKTALIQPIPTPSGQRAFEPLKSIRDDIHQISNIPSHIVNMHLLMDSCVVLIDPRFEHLGPFHVEKSKLLSSYVVEELKLMKHSLKNDFQFYCLSDVFLRVFDTRYPRVPLQQINHMLDTSMKSKRLHLDFIDLKNEDSETLCIASSDSLCFITFERNGDEPVLNPTSTHQPLHDSVPTKLGGGRTEFSGLAVHHDDRSLFNIIQMNDRCNLIVRTYQITSEDQRQNDDAMEIVSEVRSERYESRRKESVDEIDMDNRGDVYADQDTVDSGTNDLDIFDTECLHTLEGMISSNRARERYDTMKERLGTP